MSAQFRGYLDAERLADIARNEAPADGPMRPFYVQIKAAAVVRKTLDVWAVSKVAAQKQHECLCLDGEQAIALTPEEFFQRVDASEPSAQEKSDREYERALSEQIGRLVRGGYLG